MDRYLIASNLAIYLIFEKFEVLLTTIGLVNMKMTPNVQILKNGGDDHIHIVFSA